MAKSNSNLSFILKVFSLLAILLIGIVNRENPESEMKSENLIKVDQGLNMDTALPPIKKASIVQKSN